MTPFKSINCPPVVFIIIAALFVYSFGLGGEFVIDDRTYFVDNDLLTTIKPWEFHRFFIEPSNYWGEHLPLRDFLYSVQFYFFSLNPLGYHLVSLTLYLFIIWTAYYLLRLISSLSSDEPADSTHELFITLLIIAFFCFHPIHVESVVYVSGQKDLLCVLYSLLAISFSLRILQKDSYVERKLFLLLVLTYYAAFLSKHLAVGTGLFITITSLYFRKKPDFYKSWLPKWIAINIPVLIWMLYSISLGNKYWGEMNNVVEINLFDRILRSMKILGWHYKIAVWPHPLNFGYPFSAQNGFDSHFYIGLLGTGLLLTIFYYYKSRLVRLGVLFILCFFLPVSQLFATFQNAAIFDRYLFVPVFGLGMILGGIFLQSQPKKWCGVWLKIGGFSGVILLTILTLNYIPVYNKNLSVDAHAYKTFPDWNVTSFNYTYTLIEHGDLAEASVMLDSEENLRTPLWVYDYFMGWILFKKGLNEKSIEYLRKSYWSCMVGGYYPFAGVPLAKALIAVGDVGQARIILQPLLLSKINNPLEYYKAKKLFESIDELKNRI